jgi:hypothetical protein
MQAPTRTLWIDYLRSFITVLVVAHHSSLAYTTFASFNKDAYILSTHPIVDTQRWVGLDIFENFNDVFFMSLMFFISGLFVLPSLSKKGTAAFIRDRFYRLFLPFMIGVTLLMMLAYYPAYYVAKGKHDISGYIIDYFTTEGWPVGPPWFIWVLFLFNLVLALLYPALKGTFEKTSRLLAAKKSHALLLIGGFVVLTWILYVPMAMLYGANSWAGFGPFDFQKSRLLLYFGYFIAGALTGNASPEKSIFSSDAALVKKWPWWVVSSLLIYILLTIIPAPLIRMVESGSIPALSGWLIYHTVYVLSCVFSGIAFLAAFKAFIHSRKSWWDSLSSNAYSIYLLHYIFVVWCQYALLNWPLHAFIKFSITCLFALTASWALSALIRKQPLIRKYL